MKNELTYFKLGCLMLLLLCCVMSPVLQAKELKPKSETLGLVLAFDPFPADTLFYSGRWGQGLINFSLGALSGALIYASLDLIVNRDPCESEDGGPPLGCGLDGLLGVMGLVLAVPAYVGILVWDGFSGMEGIRLHNQKVATQRAQGLSLAPSFTLGPQGPLIGLSGRF